MKHLNLYYPQWQGSGTEKTLLTGAKTIMESGLIQSRFYSVPVSEAQNGQVRKNILGYDVVLPQLQKAKALIAGEKPETIFTIGGGCDVEIAPISYLNGYYKGDLTVLWLDAHGDLNTPESSPSKTAHGMPLQALLGGIDAFADTLIPNPLRPEQILLAGQRDLDAPEAAYIKKHKVRLFEQISLLEEEPDQIIKEIKERFSQNIYIHIDLDVLDIVEFPEVLVPAAGGISTEALLRFTALLKEECSVKGMSLLEFTGKELTDRSFFSKMIAMGCSL